MTFWVAAAVLTVAWAALVGIAVGIVAGGERIERAARVTRRNWPTKELANE